MPNAPKRICRYQQCHIKTKDTYCDKHKHLSTPFGGSKTDPWYNKPIWKGNPNKPLGKRGGLREQQLLKVPYCESCKERGIIKDVTGKGEAHVDHITPFRSAPKEKQWYYFSNPSNLQTLCKDCHQRKTSQS